MVGHGGSSAGSYLADPTSPIPSHCVVIILFKCVAVHQSSWLALKVLMIDDWNGVSNKAAQGLSLCVVSGWFDAGATCPNSVSDPNHCHPYKHKPLSKIKETICSHQADSPLYVWPDLVICKFRKIWSYMTLNVLTETKQTQTLVTATPYVLVDEQKKKACFGVKNECVW